MGKEIKLKSLTSGNPIKLILLFSIPLAIGTLFQQFYSIVDTRIVGVTLGEDALAAVGGTSTISDLLINFMMGITNGFAIIVATFFGAKDEKGVKKSVGAVFSLAFIITLVLTLGCLLFMNPILKVLNVPADIFDSSKGYIMVIIAGLICTALYNACAGILRAIGDTVTPLIFLIIASFLNIFLDYGFILGFGMGVSGAALATIIAQGLSCIACFIYMWKKYPLLRFSKADMGVFGTHISRMLKAGISMGFMSAFVSFGTVSLQTAINTFGKNIIVAHAAARKLTMVCMLPFGVFGQALATYCGQNMGAGKYERIKTGIKQTVFLTWGWCILVIIAMNTVSPELISLVTGSKSKEILENGSLYLKFDTAFYFVPTLITLLRNSLQGVGDSVTPVVSSSVEFVGKLIIALTLAPLMGYFGIIIAEPIVWVLMVIPLIWQYFKNPYIQRLRSE